MATKVTIQDIANELQLSRNTVSKAINKHRCAGRCHTGGRSCAKPPKWAISSLPICRCFRKTLQKQQSIPFCE